MFENPFCLWPQYKSWCWQQSWANVNAVVLIWNDMTVSLADFQCVSVVFGGNGPDALTSLMSGACAEYCSQFPLLKNIVNIYCPSKHREIMNWPFKTLTVQIYTVFQLEDMRERLMKL